MQVNELIRRGSCRAEKQCSLDHFACYAIFLFKEDIHIYNNAKSTIKVILRMPGQKFYPGNPDVTHEISAPNCDWPEAGYVTGNHRPFQHQPAAVDRPSSTVTAFVMDHIF